MGKNEYHWIGILLMWPVTFPFYFAQRAKRRRPSLVLFAVLAVLLAFGGFAIAAADPSWTKC